MRLTPFSEAVAWRYSVKKAFLENKINKINKINSAQRATFFMTVPLVSSTSFCSFSNKQAPPETFYQHSFQNFQKHFQKNCFGYKLVKEEKDTWYPLLWTAGFYDICAMKTKRFIRVFKMGYFRKSLLLAEKWIFRFACAETATRSAL